MTGVRSRKISSQIRTQLYEKIARIASPYVEETIGVDRLIEFIAHYFKHVDTAALLNRDPGVIAHSLLHHSVLARQRREGHHCLEIHRPDSKASWQADGHHVLTLVTDDRAGLVETVRMILARTGWNVKDVIHPQFQAVRDERGYLIDMAHRSEGRLSIAESWVWMELTAPLGRDSYEAIADTKQAILTSLDDLDRVDRDAQAMHEMMLATAESLNENGDEESQRISQMLRWMADGRFLCLGVRDFSYPSDKTDIHFTPHDEGWGILAEDHRAYRSFGAYPHEDDRVALTKDSQRSTIWADRYLDYVGVVMDAQGQRFERRFLGLFSRNARTERVEAIPLVNYKAQQVAARIGYEKDSYGGRSVASSIESHPKDELFQASIDQLTETISALVELDGSNVAVFVREGHWRRFVSVLIYFPRERYNTVVRRKVTDHLLATLAADDVQWSVNVDDSALARLYLTLKIADDVDLLPIDVEQLTTAIDHMTRSWDDRFAELADRIDSAQRGIDFSSAYKDSYEVDEAIADLRSLNTVVDEDDIDQRLVVSAEDGVDARLKIARVGSPLLLSHILPHLACLGIDVVDERPFELSLRGREAYLYDVGLRFNESCRGFDQFKSEDCDRLTDAIAASYRGWSEADEFSALIIDASLNWCLVSVLRALARYMRQLGISYSVKYIAQSLKRHPQLAAQLVDFFESRFAIDLDDEERHQRLNSLEADIDVLLEKVSRLDDDAIIRAYRSVILSIVRTNYYSAHISRYPSGTVRDIDVALAFKIHPRDIAFVEGPQPLYEIFVYSPDVEGVHLRFGEVARGGLRWSDRAEDYRTEVMGLVRAQMVKNSIIVPVGAKGGFYPRHLDGLTPSQRFEKGKESYAAFIRALLSVTDNIVDNLIVHPEKTHCWDGDDPYLVVAADKGTATFSDLANAIAAERGFWLKDAFASGGSAGYDHKGMGITARGAWISVKRHLKELGIDSEKDPFTCVGIGDMSGDVFGNGMLLSTSLKLVAAFNHMHIFIDPDPDAQVAYEERRRLFEMPRSTWDDYDRSLISDGGGVYSRSIKAIPLNDKIRAVLGIDSSTESITPNEMVSAILKAPVDLMWNGGIGTWVKASDQTHADAGDRTNNPVRIDANQVRARCVGEGGNLGWTQAGRIEYARQGGKINTDFIDNSAGVDTSDYEVNIKILLQEAIARGELESGERDQLLYSMTDEIAHLVLAHNESQNLALANSLMQAVPHARVHSEIMDDLEARGEIHRDIDALPTRDQMDQRIARGEGLTCPELSMLLAHVKIDLANSVIDSLDMSDETMQALLIDYFPAILRDRYRDLMASHRLARQIVTTILVNKFVDTQGISAAYRLRQESGRDFAAIMKAHMSARSLVQADRYENNIPSDIPYELQRALHVDIRMMVERATRWICAHDDETLTTKLHSSYRQIADVLNELPALLGERSWTQFKDRADQLIAALIPAQQAYTMASWSLAHLALPIVAISQATKAHPSKVAKIYVTISDRLNLDLLYEMIEQMPKDGRWQMAAYARCRRQLSQIQERIVTHIIHMDADRSEVIRWEESCEEGQLDSIADMIVQIGQETADLAPISVVIDALQDLDHSRMI